MSANRPVIHIEPYRRVAVVIKETIPRFRQSRQACYRLNSGRLV